MNTPLPNTLDDFVEAFESARAENPRVELLDYLPPATDVLYAQVAAELIRIDMEHSWNNGQRKPLQEYRKLLPGVFENKQLLEEIAFEEYRLRQQAGEQVSQDQYEADLGISTASWGSRAGAPTGSASGGADKQGNVSSSALIWDEALELAEDVQGFPAVGESFAGFSLKEKLGRGAFSYVFLARQDELAQRRVVLKIAAGNSLEPQHLARLQHTNIVPIYSVHRQENLTAVCMPYFGRRTLGDLLTVLRDAPDGVASNQNLISTFLARHDPTIQVGDRPSNVTVATQEKQFEVVEVLKKSGYVDAVVWLMQQVAAGLSHAHQRGILHRDLKPANILLTDEGLPMLLDFNLSEDVVVHGRTSLLVGGTLPYMSPEQIQAVSTGGKLGFQADIYSLGVLFYELLTGSRPFVDRQGPFEGVLQAMLADRQNTALELRTKNPAIPCSIESVVRRCLAFDLKDRYQTVEQLKEDLDRHLRHEPLRFAPDHSLSERSRKWIKRHPRLTSAGGVAAVASCALLVMFGLWMLRGARVARLEAEEVFHTFVQQQPSLQMALGMPQSDEEVLAESLKTTQSELEAYGILQRENWRESSSYRSLSELSRQQLDQHLAESLYAIAKGNEKLIEASTSEEKRAELLRQAQEANRLARSLYSPESCPQALVLQQARLLELAGASSEAEQLRQLAAAQPTEAAVDTYAKAYDFFAAKDYEHSLPMLMSLRDRSPTDPLAWTLLGDAYAGSGSFQKSEGCFTTAISLQPESYVSLVQRGLCRMQLHDYQEALADFDRVVKLKPQLTTGYLNRGLALSQLGKIPLAIDDLTKALELGAPQTRIYFIRSRLRKMVGDATGALADEQEGLRRTPTDELSWVARGVAKRVDDPEAALADFRQALKLNPVSASAMHQCIHVLADRLGREAEALEQVSQLLSLYPEDTDALASRAVLHARGSNRKAALADVRKLLNVSKSPKVLFQAACVYSLCAELEQRHTSDALILLGRAVHLEPTWLLRAQSDPDLQKVRDTPAYGEFLANHRDYLLLKQGLTNSTTGDSSDERPRSSDQK